MLDYQSLSFLILSLILVVGLVLLMFGGDWLARGAGSLAVNLKINPVIVGLTVVAVATSMPELIVCMLAGAKGNFEIATNNIVGSNLGNIGLIMGVAALIYPMTIQNRLIRQEMPFLLFATLLFIALGYSWSGGVHQISRIDAFILLAVITAYIVFLVVQAKRSSKQDSAEFDEDLSNPIESIGLCVVLVVGGGLALAAGADLLIGSAEQIALRLNMSQGLVGLTIVALGTSLPELAASVSAALRKQGDIIAGNIVGSNIFNLLLIGGGVGVIYPIEMEAGLFRMEYPVLLVFTLLLWFAFFTGRKVMRWEGAALLVLYFASIVFIWLSDSESEVVLDEAAAIEEQITE